MTSWGDCLQNDLKAIGAVRRIGIGRKWVAFEVVVKDGLYWLLQGTWACDTEGSRRERKHSITPDNA